MTRCCCCCCCCCCDVVPRTLYPGQGGHHGAGPRLGDHGAVSPRHLAAARTRVIFYLLFTLCSTRRHVSTLHLATLLLRHVHGHPDGHVSTVLGGHVDTAPRSRHVRHLRGDTVTFVTCNSKPAHLAALLPRHGAAPVSGHAPRPLHRHRVPTRAAAATCVCTRRLVRGLQQLQ